MHSSELLYAGLILSLPGLDVKPWHQDGMPLLPGLSPSEDMSPLYAINVFFPLTDSDGCVEAGLAEFVIPGSHVMEEEAAVEKADCNSRIKLQFKAEHYVMRTRKTLELSVHKETQPLLHDYRVCHRGTPNLPGNGRARRMLYLIHARPWFKEHLNFGTERLFRAEGS